MTKYKTKYTYVAQTLSEERKREQENAIRQLEKLKEFEASHTMYSYKLPNGIIISSLKKERIEEMKDTLCVNK